ncbi:AMP binding enzyme [Ceratobasidium sp. AG-Ba]|nr:AMP binding enzyme [Ceratobasidium sp. AG-Ba]
MSLNQDGTFSSLAPPLNEACSPPTDISIAQFMLDSAHPLRPIRDANSPWLIEDETGRGIGYEEVRTRTWGLANGMRRRWPHIVEDDVVCIYSPNNVDYPIVIWGRTRIPVTSDKFKAPIHASGKYQLINEGLASAKSFEEKQLAPGENKTKVAFYSFSSGTTGKPKAVAIPHHAVIANVIQNAAFVRLNDPDLPPDLARYRRGDVNLGVLPMFHIYGLVMVTHFGLFAGLPLVVIPQFNFVEMLKSIVKYRITHLSLVPPQVVLFCKHPATKNYDFSHCHFALVGAAPVSPELTAQFRQVMPNLGFGQAYGMTETATIVTIVTLEHAKTGGVPGSAGQLINNTTAKVVKQDGTLAGYDEPGELVVAGPQMTLRYENNEAATEETYVDGWVHTGDEVVIKKSGDVFIVDRLKELIKVRGFQVAPAELEGHLLDHPFVDDVGVIGLPDDYSGEVPLAFVALSPYAKKSGLSDIAIKNQLTKFVSDKKVNYKWLKGGVVFIDSIPKNPSGKILVRATIVYQMKPS